MTASIIQFTSPSSKGNDPAASEKNTAFGQFDASVGALMMTAYAFSQPLLGEQTALPQYLEKLIGDAALLATIAGHSESLRLLKFVLALTMLEHARESISQEILDLVSQS